MFVAGKIVTEGSKRAPQIETIDNFETEKEAIDFAVELVLHDREDDEKAQEIRDEIECDGDFADETGLFTVFVSQLG